MLKNVRIGGRLGLGFGIMLLIVIAVGATGYWGVRESTQTTVAMLQGDATISEYASLAATNVLGLRRYEKDLFLNLGNHEHEKEYLGKWNDQRDHLVKNLQELEKLVVLQKEKDAVKAMKEELAAYEAGVTKIYQGIEAGRIRTPAQANAATEPYKAGIHKFEGVSKEMAEESNHRMDSKEKVMIDLSRHVTLLVLGSILVSLIVGILVSFLISRSITAPINAAVEIAKTVAEGDLTVVVEVNSKDEVGELLTAMQTMVQNLMAMIGKIRGTSGEVASAAGQISANTQQLTKSAHGQASATEETSATMVQMAASIQTVAANADSLAANADEVSSSIEELGASSEQVAKSADVMASAVAETSATIEQMTISIDNVAQNADELMTSVAETSATIEQITVSIDQVATNSQELQKVVADSSSTIEEMAASIRQVAKNVEEADQVAKGAAKEGNAGLEAGQQAVAAMGRVAEVIEKTSDSILNLGRRSEEIGNIVKVIGEIADQTNLLALNAAIEAARAGDAGRGFAVVADEVRKLAERSMGATKEIAQVIRQVQVDTGESVKFGEIASQEAKNSMELITLAGNSLENIVSSIDRTSTLMSDIARMTAEQSNASNQVLQAVEQMSGASDVVANAAREQATGGRQIRIAVERMNQLTQEVTGSAKEQALGSRQIRIAVENMNQVTGQVTIATREQSLSARQIVGAVNSMTSMTQSVANATAEQKKGGEMVVVAMDNISDITRENLSAVEQLSRAAQNLTQQAEEMTALVGTFKVA
ncbi:methyl-accepting chemotaxis protein [Geomonas propionica]|uniref:MCP four helix bundle domain-containing protein n=1 Tax=Geomonas propionica TaxID=2798582 RepID=A0ABS0YRI2_9BACT|nr:methyl-accepting chemotaxis protein [Geomonas propionica]MBJ6800580.1 MCP four helix bundle domain-containing protein [Geomonas propionica]